VFVDPDGNIATFTTDDGNELVRRRSCHRPIPSPSLTAISSSRRVQRADLGNWTERRYTVDPLSFTTDQTSGGLVRGITWNGRFYAFGNKASWDLHDASTSPFPLAKADTSSAALPGLLRHWL
jgi:hypothetical protein